MTIKENKIKEARGYANSAGLLRIRHCQLIFDLSASGVRTRCDLPDTHENKLDIKKEGGPRGRVWITLESVIQSINAWTD